MLSAKDYAAVKIAVAICNNSEFKYEIISDKAPSIRPRFARQQKHHPPATSYRCEVRAEVLVDSLGLPDPLPQNVIVWVKQIATWMNTWADYHERTFGLSRSYIADFLNTSFFTSYGRIDGKKAAEELLKDKTLSIRQRYKLACMYCIKGHITSFCRQMGKKNRKCFYDFENPDYVNEPPLIKYWTYYSLGKITKLEAVKHPYQYGFEVAVESGNQVAVEYFLERINEETGHFHVISAALKIIKPKLKYLEHDCYVDILYFLLLQMSENEQIEFLMEDIRNTFCDEYVQEDHHYITALHCLLCFPYQNHFMKLSNLMWGILPVKVYANLLLAICGKINPQITSLEYEAEIFNYRKLFNEYWCQSPDHYKNYVVSNEVILDWNNEKKTLNVGKELLYKLCNLKNFTVEDEKNFEIIFQSIKEKEMISSGNEQQILSSEERDFICFRLILKNKWKMADEFLSNCLLSREKICKSKRDLVYGGAAIDYFISLLRNGKVKQAEVFLKWSSLSEKEVCQYKREVMNDYVGFKGIIAMIFGGKGRIADKFIKWSFSSKEEAKEFKKEVVYSLSGMHACQEQILRGRIDLVDEFISVCLSSKKEIKEYKKKFSLTLGGKICCEFIAGYTLEAYEKLEVDLFNFKESRWKHVNNFMSWCFSSDVEIKNFKEKFLAVEGEVCYASFMEVMHLILVIRSSFSDIEKLYVWFDLSPEKISKLKKDTILSPLGLKVLRGVYRAVFFDPGKKATHNKLKMCVEWCLVDAEAVAEFKCRFDRNYWFKNYLQQDNQIYRDIRDNLNEFYDFVGKLNTGSNDKVFKRPLEFPNKRQCITLPTITVSSYSVFGINRMGPYT